MTPPSIQSLTAKFLASPTAADFPHSEVEPHESAGGFRADTAAAWRDAGFAAGMKTPAPSFWADLAAKPSTGLFPIALGHCPQQLGDLAAALALKPGIGIKSQPAAHFDSGAVAWAEKLAKKDPRVGQLWTAALHRLAGRYAAADTMLTELAQSADSAFLTVIANERGAVAYAAGKLADAERYWSEAGASPVTQFNQGVAAFARGDAAAAAKLFTAAAGQLPAGGGWSSLATLLALVSGN